jgi:DNA-binding MarR family transcriptional regulator
VTTAPIRVGPGFRREFPGASPSAAEAAANLVRAAMLFLDELRRRRAPIASLSASGFEALAILDGAGGPLPSHRIAERLLVSTASMTSLLDTLERKGLVRRSPHPSDRRKILVSLTDAGGSTVDQMLPVVYQASTETFAGLTETERRTLVDVLGRIEDRLGLLATQMPGTPRPRNKPARRSRSKSAAAAS